MAILAAVDGDQRPARTVEVGSELANRYDVKLVVVHVMPQDLFDARRRALGETGDATGQSVTPVAYGALDDGSVAAGGSDASYSVEDASRDAEAVARDVVEKTLGARDDIEPRGRVGRPTEEILAVAADVDPRYLVVGGRKRTPVGKAMFGSTTQSVLLDADRPVVTVMTGG